MEKEVSSLNDINPNIPKEQQNVDSEKKEFVPNAVSAIPEGYVPPKTAPTEVKTITNPLPDSANYGEQKDKSKDNGLNIDMEDFNDLKDEPIDEDSKVINTLEEDMVLPETPGQPSDIKEDSEIIINVEPEPTKEDITTTEEEPTLDEDMDPEKKEEEDFKELQKDLKDTLQLFNKVNLKAMKISNQPMNPNNVVPLVMAKTSDWVMPAANNMMSMKEWKGFDLTDVLVDDNTRSTYNRYMSTMGKIYAQITSPKPASVDLWVKVTPYDVLDDIYMLVYRSSFAGANHIPYRCPFCGKQHVVRDVPMEKMVKYKDEETEKKYKALLESSATDIPKQRVVIKQVSDNYAIGMKLPSIYDKAIEPLLLSQDLRTKYDTILDNIAYIENIYCIVGDELRPLDVKKFPGNPEKELRERIMKYANVLNSLTPDQYIHFLSLRGKMNRTVGDITYILPGSICPKCHKESSADETSAQQLLFIRHQLAAIANS